MLKILMLQKQRTALQTELNRLHSHRNALVDKEKQLRSQLEALGDDAGMDAINAISDQVDDLTRQQTECEDQAHDTMDKIADVDKQIKELEENSGVGSDDASQRHETAAPRMRSADPVVEGQHFQSRSRCFSSRRDMNAFYERSEIKDFLKRVRDMAASGRRSVSGAELTIPDVMLDIIRQNMGEYSRLISHVRLRSVRGTSRQNIMGRIPDGVWTEMCGALNELEFAFTQIELDGFKAGGFVSVCNAILYDNDVALGEEILSGILHAIGRVLDKAIVYGKGPASKMPVGIVTRLAQAEQPAYWGANQGAWTDLHSSHVIKLNLAGTTGTAFFAALMAAMGKADPDYSVSKRTVWLCNRATHMDLLGRGLAFSSAGALVAGLNDRMPVEGGQFVELDFLPDNEIIGGYMDDYLLVEREGAVLAQSEHVLFVEDQTVFKGTARYDGQPVIGEGFVAINYANTDVTTSYNFAPDYANTKLNVLIATAAAGTATGDTVVTVSGSIADAPTLKYSLRNADSLKVGAKLPASGWSALTSGTTQITAAAGTPITVVELDSANRVISVGNVVSVPKT